MGDERNFLERFSNNAERQFRLSIPARQAKIPVHDVLATPVPFVGPSINECPRASCGEGLSYLPVQGSSLRLVSIPVAVESDFRYQQRTIAGEILEPREIGLIFVLRLEENVETNQIEKGQIQIFRRWIVCVGNENFRILFLHFAP